MNTKTFLSAILLFCGLAASAAVHRTEVLLENGWKFHRGDAEGAYAVEFDDSSWENVSVPHDWAITGPFDESNDLQIVAVTQNFETEATRKTGRTGGLPYIGTGWYRTTFNASKNVVTTLVFDGAMSQAEVYVNGEKVCFWPYGYSPFQIDVTKWVKDGNNVLAVRLENLPNSSRWYPGAGLYRNVHLVTASEIHIPEWGMHVTTPHVADDFASVRLAVKLEGAAGKKITLVSRVEGADGNVCSEKTLTCRAVEGQELVQNFIVDTPALWSPESPSLYYACTEVYADDELVDVKKLRFGIRSIEYIPEKGFFLNGSHRKFQGVCNHHDLGPLGAAINVSALRHQLLMLKNMGCDAIRTSHNMPAPELVDLCDEMGFMMMLEPFDEWDIAKCENGYHRFFNEESDIKGMTWAERDMINMLHRWRNNPSVVMWSIGNEVPTQCSPEGYRVASFLQDICHREDPTRPCTCGMDQVSCVLENGFALVLDIPGLNYRTFRYLEAYRDLPHGFVLGSETASTVSSRGVYKLPAEKRFGAVDADHQCSSYDLDACVWSNVPDIDFALADDYPWTMGQFVWTGFDYLGEPSPYDTDAWPNHSSMFGIIDLASIPKDRYWLYRSIWNRNEPTLHILPHWNWTEGETVPVFVYTSYPEVELFVNGKSCGRKAKQSGSNSQGLQNEDLEGRYRLMWKDVVYHAGELKAVAYDSEGKPAGETVVRTAGKPHHIELVYGLEDAGICTPAPLKADGKDLAYITAKVVDKDGNLCPFDSSLMKFSVSGAGRFRAAANGDPTCLDLFHLPKMHAFGGKLTIVVQAAAEPGEISLEVKAKGLKGALRNIPVL